MNQRILTQYCYINNRLHVFVYDEAFSELSIIIISSLHTLTVKLTNFTRFHLKMNCFTIHLEEMKLNVVIIYDMKT